MQVSAIIPTYNRAAILPRALESVFAQAGVSFEVIVVDDGSTDDTADKLKNAEIQYFYQPNRGPAAARNLGISKAKGKFIAFLDSDDEWLPGKLAAQLQYFTDHPDSLICQTEEIWIRNGKRVNPMKKHKKEEGWIFERSLELCLVSPSAVMMRREFFDRVGLFDEMLPACEDYDLWLRASARFPIGLIEKPFVVRYGGHADQRSREFPAMDRFRIQSIRKILESGLLNPEQKKAAARTLAKKSEIVRLGALKRGKIKEAEFYGQAVSS